MNKNRKDIKKTKIIKSSEPEISLTQTFAPVVCHKIKQKYVFINNKSLICCLELPKSWALGQDPAIIVPHGLPGVLFPRIPHNRGQNGA